MSLDNRGGPALRCRVRCVVLFALLSHVVFPGDTACEVGLVAVDASIELAATAVG
jgi:hypothetical protein